MNSFVQSINSDSITRFSRGLFLSPAIAKYVSWLLILTITFMLSLFAWSIWQYFQPRHILDPMTVNQSTQKKSTDLNINKLMSYNLFGDPKAVVNSVDNSQIDAPVTRLKLKLRGVYSTDDDELAGAMIEAQNKQEVYRLGSKLPGAANLKLHKIMSDRVIMSRGGKFETLLIEDFGKIKGLSSGSTRNRNSGNNLSSSFNSTTIDKRNDVNLSKELNKLRAKMSDPQSLSELISVTPVSVGNQFQGFRISPGKNRALFGRLGLRRNDLVTSVNGVNLDDPASALSLMQQISTAEEIDLKIKRGTRELNILFSTNPDGSQ